MVEAESFKQKEVAELKERISVLEKELDNANDLLSDPKRRGQQRCLWLPSAGAQQTLTRRNVFLIFYSWRRVCTGSPRRAARHHVSHRSSCRQDQAGHEAHRGTSRQQR